MMIHDTDFNRKQLIRVGQEFLLIYIYILYPFFLSSPPNRLLFDFSYYNMFVTFLCFFFIFISYTAVSYLQNLWSPFLISVHLNCPHANSKRKKYDLCFCVFPAYATNDRGWREILMCTWTWPWITVLKFGFD